VAAVIDGLALATALSSSASSAAVVGELETVLDTLLTAAARTLAPAQQGLDLRFPLLRIAVVSASQLSVSPELVLPLSSLETAQQRGAGRLRAPDGYGKDIVLAASSLAHVVPSSQHSLLAPGHRHDGTGTSEDAIHTRLRVVAHSLPCSPAPAQAELEYSGALRNPPSCTLLVTLPNEKAAMEASATAGTWNAQRDAQYQPRWCPNGVSERIGTIDCRFHFGILAFWHRLSGSFSFFCLVF
jgi:hypothetical protein